MGRRKRWERGLVLVLALNLLFSVIPSDMISPIRAEAVEAEEYQAQTPAEAHAEESLKTSLGEESAQTENTDISESDNSEFGAPLQEDEPESQEDAGSREETGETEKAENPEAGEESEKLENPEGTKDPGETQNPEEQKVPEVSGNDPEKDMPGEEAQPEEEPELEEEPEEEPDEYTETWEGSMTPEELGSLGGDEVGAAVWLNGSKMFRARGRSRSSWSFDAYYVNQDDPYYMKAADDFSLKYQMEFHTDENLPENHVEIRIPAALVPYRDAAKSPAPSAVAVPEGSQGSPVATRNSPFNYYIDKKGTNDQSKWEIVFFNYKKIPAGTNAAWQVLYRDLKIMEITDETFWSRQAKASVTIPAQTEKNEDGEEEVVSPARTEQGESEPLTGESDSMVNLISVSKEPFSTGRSYTPGLYTESQVKQYAGLNVLTEKYAGTNFNDYWYAVWKVDIRGKATQPWNLVIEDLPSLEDGTEGEVVGTTVPANKVNRGVQWGKTEFSKEKDPDGTFLVVAAYPKNGSDVMPLLKNEVKVTMEPYDKKDPVQEKSAQAQWQYKDYQWDYNPGDILQVRKKGDETLKGALELCSYDFEQGEDYGSFNFSTTATAYGYGLTHVTPKDTGGTTALYPVGTPGVGAVGTYVNDTSYELVTMDDFMYAIYNGKRIELDGEDYYFTKIRISQSDEGYDIWEDRTAAPQSIEDIRKEQNDTSLEDVNQDVKVYVMYQGEEGWQLLKPLPWSKGKMTCELTEKDFDGKMPYRVMVRHKTVNYSTFCRIDVEVRLRHGENSEIAEVMKKYRDPDGADKADYLQLQDISGGMVLRYDKNGTHTMDACRDPHIADKEVYDATQKLYKTEGFYSRQEQIYRWDASKMLYGIGPYASAEKASKSSNDVINGRVLVDYYLTAQEGYEVYSKEAVNALKAAEPDREDYPDRKKAVFCDLLPYGMRFDPSSPVKAGRLTDPNNTGTSTGSWDSAQVTVTVDSEKDIIENYRGTGRTLVMFHVEYAGADPGVYARGKWMSGFGVSFQAYYDWKDLKVAEAATNICAYMPEPEDTQELISAGRQGSPVCRDDGERSWDSWSEQEKKIYAPFRGGNIRELEQDEYEKTQQNKKGNVLYAEAGVSGGYVVAGESGIKKLVRADEDRFGVYAEKAVVEPGSGYTYDLTVSNQSSAKLKDIVVYDRLERADIDRGEALTDPNYASFGEPVWTGEFVSVVTDGLIERGIEPKVYYNAGRAAVTSKDGENAAKDPDQILTEENGWYPAEEFVTGTRTLADVRAVAVDLRRNADGTEFKLDNMDSVTFQIKMRAPETMPEKAECAYNNASFYSKPDNDGAATQQDGDSVCVRLKAGGILEVAKEFMREEEIPESVRGAAFEFCLRQGEGDDSTPFANQEYELWKGEEKNEDRLYATDADGCLTLCAGERAVFRNVPDTDRIYVAEREDPFWKAEMEDVKEESDGVSVRTVTVKNAYRPVLYVQKNLRGVPAGVNTEEESFTFRIEADGVPLKNAEFWYVDRALSDGGIPSKVISLGDKGVGKTDDKGEFRIKKGQIVALFPGFVGTDYRLTEILPEDTAEKTCDWVCPESVREGTIAVKGNLAGITNYYRWKDLLLTKKITHQEREDYEKTAQEFTFRIEEAAGGGDSLERIEWVLLDNDRNPVGSWKKLEHLRDGDGSPAGMGFACACAGKTVRLRNLEQKKTYVVTETAAGELYRAADGGTVKVTMPLYSGSTAVSVTNDYLMRPLSVTKTVVYDQTDTVKTEELKTREFTMTVTIGEDKKPLADHLYVLKARDGTVIPDTDPAYPCRTDGNGSFKLKNGQTAVFRDAGMLGEIFEVTETPDPEYPQIYPDPNPDPAQKTEPLRLTGDGGVLNVINGAAGNFMIRKEYMGEDAAGEDFVNKMLAEEEARNDATVCFTLRVKDSKDEFYTWPKENTSVDVIDQMTGISNSRLWTAGEEFRVKPWETIVLTPGQTAGIKSYVLRERKEDRHRLIRQEDGSFLEISQKSPAGDEGFRGTPEENPVAVIVNSVKSVEPEGSVIEKRMAPGCDPVPEGAELVWRLEKYENGRFLPAEGVSYLILDGEGGPVCDRALTTGEDGEIVLSKPEKGYPKVHFISDTVQLNQYGTGLAEGTLRLVEIPEKSNEAWGTLAGYGGENAAEGRYSMDLAPEEAKAFVNSNRTTPIEIAKEMKTPSDETFTMILRQVLSTSNTGETEKLQIVESAARQGIPYEVYDMETGESKGKKETGRNGEILLRAGQYARLELPDQTRWTVSEEQKMNIPLKEMRGQEEIPGKLTKLEENLMLIYAEAEQKVGGTTSITQEDVKNGVVDAKTKETVVLNTGNVTVPEFIVRDGVEYCVTGIGDTAFYNCSGLTSIEIPSGVTSIGMGAFTSCRSLTKITMPEGVTSIGSSAFGSCSSLTSIEIPSGVTSIEGSVFAGCSGLKEITIPSGVTSIGDWAFGGCSSLKEITIPSGVTSIGDYAFYICGSLTSMTIPEGVTSIGDNAFWACTSLTEVMIPSGVTSIGKDAFAYCRLTEITIPESVTTIGSNAFSDCYRLTTITINKPQSSISGAPWGATKATVVWTGGN